MIEVKPLQPSKALQPIEVTLSGIVIEVKPLQFLKASSPIEVTSFFIVTVKEVKPLQPAKTDGSIILVTSFRVTYFKYELFLINLVQFEEISSP